MNQPPKWSIDCEAAVTYVVAKVEWDIDISGRRYASGFDHLSVLGVDESVGLAIGDAGHGGPKAVIRRGKNSPVATFESGWC